MVKMYDHTKNGGSMLTTSKVVVQTHRHTDTPAVWKHYLPAYGRGNETGLKHC